MNARVLLAVTTLNLSALAGSAILLYQARPSGLAATPVVEEAVAAPAAAPVPDRVSLAANDAEHSAEREMQFATLVAEVFNLRGEVEALQMELRDAKAAPLGSNPEASGPSSQNAPTATPEAYPTAAEEFLEASGNSDGLENIGSAFSGGGGVELLSSNCLGNMCRVSYDVAADAPGERRRAVAALTRRIAESVETDVDMVFAREGGESVVYIKRAN